MPDARFIRRFRFSASHRYERRDWSREQNRSVFGLQASRHAHDWLLEIRTVGPIDPQTGFSVDLTELDTAVEALTSDWNGGDLNVLIPEVASGAIMPSTESLARWVYEQLVDRMGGPSRLERVTLFESPEVGAEYPAGDSA
jgi:6-pyruvoyltetrahydropterin/6-carboxytetrahydropterin synthase